MLPKNDDRIGYDKWFHWTYTTVGDCKTVAEYTLRTYLEQDIIRRMLERNLRVYPKFRNTNYKRALDFGCGYGRLTPVLGEFFEEVHGIDIRDNVIAIAKEAFKAFPKFKFESIGKLKEYLGIHPDVIKLPFEDGYFDLTMTFTVLQHIKEVEKWLKELKRITSKFFLIVEEVIGKVSKHEFPRPVEEYVELLEPFVPVDIMPRLLYSTSCRPDTSMAIFFVHEDYLPNRVDLAHISLRR